jgi:hypothetical protein
MWSLAGEGNGRLRRARHCARVAHDQPALAHSKTGIVFALAGGTRTLALRLPPDALAAALAVEGLRRTVSYPSTVISTERLGPAWAFVDIGSAPVRSWCRAAYHAAGPAPSPPGAC